MTANRPLALSHEHDGEPRPVWEAVRVNRYYGLQALNSLACPGNVAIDPDALSVYFFLPAGTTENWHPMPAGGGLTVIAADLQLPPSTRRTPPGTYWLVPPRQGVIQSCDGSALHSALLDCLPTWAVQHDDEPHPTTGQAHGLVPRYPAIAAPTNDEYAQLTAHMAHFTAFLVAAWEVQYR